MQASGGFDGGDPKGRCFPVFAGVAGMPVLHDRMLQAAHESMSEAKRHTHLRVGRLLLSSNPDELTDEQCFAVVGELNHARPLMSDEGELHQLMCLNLRAAQQAKAAGVGSRHRLRRKGIAPAPGQRLAEPLGLSRDLYQIRQNANT